jgi:hypothetical protein
MLLICSHTNTQNKPSGFIALPVLQQSIFQPQKLLFLPWHKNIMTQTCSDRQGLIPGNYMAAVAKQQLYKQWPLLGNCSTILQ